MPTIKVKPGQLGAVLKTDASVLGGARGKVIDRALKRGAHRARGYLVTITVVDRGVLKNAWEVIKLASGYEVLNTAPYAGPVERGIRPGAKFGRAAHEAIKAWIIRKGILNGGKPLRRPTKRSTNATRYKYTAAMVTQDIEADRMAWAIIKKMEKLGRAGRFDVQKALPALTAVLAKYIVDEINKYFAAGGGTQKGGGI